MKRTRTITVFPGILATALWLVTGSPAATGETLAEKDRQSLTDTVDALYDVDNAGWGTEHKYVDASAIEWSFVSLDQGNQLAMTRVRRTLDANQNLIDPVWGGVFQYSDDVNWKSPHYEKLLSIQADDLRIYSDAYSRWHRKSDLEAAQKIFGYLTKFLSAPDGGFYVSQDADVSVKLLGHEFYAMDDAARRAAGMPTIDVHEYSRETGWAIRALCKYHDVTGDVEALERAEKAAKWALSARQIPGGGFSHGGNSNSGSNDGPYMDDNVSMTQAFLALYRSTGVREWLKAAVTTLNFIDTKLRDSRDIAQNASVVRAANMVHHYTGSESSLRIARHAMKYLTTFAAAANDQFRPDILLADHELSVAPIHITVVGHKDDPAAKALHTAALRYPTDYLQIDWWDRREGKLPDPTITYPELKQAAAFACTVSACSTPVYEPGEILERVRSVASSAQ
jgi:uncharacterized protein